MMTEVRMERADQTPQQRRIRLSVAGQDPVEVWADIYGEWAVHPSLPQPADWWSVTRLTTSGNVVEEEFECETAAHVYARWLMDDPMPDGAQVLEIACLFSARHEAIELAYERLYATGAEATPG